MASFLIFLLFSVKPLVLTPEKAVKIALENNYQVVQSRYELESSKLNSKKSLAGLVPIGSFSASYAKYRDNGNVFENSAYSLKIEQNLFDPTSLVQYLSSKRQVKIAELALSSAKSDVVVNVLKTYYLVVSAQEKANYLREFTKYAGEQLKAVRAKKEVGSATETDVLRAKINLLQAKNSLKQAEIEVEQAKRNLLQLIGLSPDTDIMIDAKGIPYINVSISLSDSLKNKVVQLQEDLKIQLLKAENARLSYRSTLFSFLPRIYLGFERNHNRTIPSMLSDYTHTVKGIYLSLYFKFNDYPFNVKLQKKSLELQKFYVKQTTYTILKNIDDAYDNWKKSLESLRLARENLKLARALYSTSKARYDVGEISTLEFFDAELKLKEANLNFIQAKYQNFVALITFKSLLGMEVWR